MNRFSDHLLLISSLKANDREAFEYLYDKYSAALYNVINKILKDEALAADVLQESFLKIWKSIRAYDPTRGTLFTWMLNIARNSAIDAHRMQARLPVHLCIEQAQDADTLYAYATLPIFDLADLNQLLDQLNPEKKQLIDLVYIQGFTHDEVAKMLMIPLGTVKSRIRKTLAQLRLCFDSPQVSVSQI